MKHAILYIIYQHIRIAVGCFLALSLLPGIAQAQVGAAKSQLVRAQNDVSNVVNDAVVLVGGNCTGTLIAPRLIATAGHCIVHNQPGGLPRTKEPDGLLPGTNDGGSDFEFPGIWYPLFNFPRGIQVTFGVNLSQPTYQARAYYYNHPGFADVIILGLDRPVPDTVAVPAPVLTRLPDNEPPAEFWSDKEFEMVGWGFTDTCRGRVVPQVRQRADAIFGDYPNLVGTPKVEPRPNQIYIIMKSGGGVALGDSGGPIFWTSRGKRYLVGTLQGCEIRGGRYFGTWATGGYDGLGKARPDLSAWYRKVLNPGYYQEQSQPVASDVRDIAACADGTVYQLRGDREIWRQDDWQIAGTGWRKERTLTEGVREISCSSNRLTYIEEDRDFMQLDRSGRPVQLGRLANTISLDGTEDSSIDFPTYWALNKDKKLWMNTRGGRDGQWQHLGTPGRTVKIASAAGYVFALNDDGTLWMSTDNGRDGRWTSIGKAPAGAYQIAAARDGQSDNARLLVLTRDSIHIGRVEPGGHVPDRIQAGDEEVFVNPEYGGYRLDWCYNWGSECGQPAADAFCTLKGYSKAKPVKLAGNFARDIGNASTYTFVLGAARSCRAATCDGFTTLTCTK